MSTVQHPFYQVGIIVPDLDPAMEELGSALGVTWGPVVAPPYDDGPKRFVFSVEGPPHIELIEGRPESPWDCSNGPRLDHIGLWTTEVETGKTQLAANGMPIDVDGADLGTPIFSYHNARACGMRVELVDQARREALYESLGRAVPGTG
jgi:hypothetical protein